jgi:hypothetical protein
MWNVEGILLQCNIYACSVYVDMLGELCISGVGKRNNTIKHRFTKTEFSLLRKQISPTSLHIKTAYNGILKCLRMCFLLTEVGLLPPFFLPFSVLPNVYPFIPSSSLPFFVSCSSAVSSQLSAPRVGILISYCCAEIRNLIAVRLSTSADHMGRLAENVALRHVFLPVIKCSRLRNLKNSLNVVVWN